MKNSGQCLLHRSFFLKGSDCEKICAMAVANVRWMPDENYHSGNGRGG